MNDPAALKPPAHYGLVWADEFDQPGPPKETHWGYDTEYNRSGWLTESCNIMRLIGLKTRAWRTDA